MPYYFGDLKRDHYPSTCPTALRYSQLPPATAVLDLLDKHLPKDCLGVQGLGFGVQSLILKLMRFG